MELIIFTGLPGSGKSSFYKEFFFNTHVRISLDLLKTRNKENKFFELGLNLQQRMVVDNTNVSLNDRKKYIAPAKNKNYTIIGYYFNSLVKDCITRNENRNEKDKVDPKVIYIKNSQLELPKYEEGFDKLFRISIEDNQFDIRDWE